MMQQGKELDDVYNEPKLDDLSMAIVDLMDERKCMPTHERLYKKGQEQLREKAEREKEKKEELENYSTISRMDITNNDPNRTNHRGKEVKEALYEMHTDILRTKQSKIEEK